MRSVGHETFGEPQDVLQQVEIDRPTPKAGEVLIKVIMAPIHNHDLWTIRGTYGTKPQLPATAGSEAVGIVEEVGPEVDPALKGRRVAAAGIPGAWAEYVIGRADAVIPVPDEMSDEAAAQLIAMPFSTITLLEFLNVKEGDWVVQTAANGAVGRIMDVLARERGVKLLNLVRREAAVKELTEAGLQNVVSTDDPDWIAKAKAIVGDDGARAAIDSVGGQVAGDLVELLGHEGLLVTFGAMAEPTLPLSSGQLIFKHITVKGFWGAIVMTQTPAEDRQRMFGELIRLVLNGKLVLTSGGDFALENPREAAKASLTAGRNGKIMFKP
ncbi:zinc-binding dehydrogenase [Paracoccus sp. PARArs4]|uniref:zinc-binding dehydrogenase n=1 Tax=Paracoccus sp. PARArs4 TaxID=2853442 RepID=UPI0024A6FD6E|nr:zinc-binding dehydrogenase [Paracoccus sp. PARArs4]